MIKLSSSERFLNEGLASYLSVRKCLDVFEQKVKAECIEFLRSKSAELRQKFRVPKASDVPEPYISADEKSREIGAGIWNNEHYICVGVVWENEMNVRAYASRYVGGKKMVNHVYDEILKSGMIKSGMIKEEEEGWYLTIYEELQEHSKKCLTKGLTSALHKWLRIGRNFSDARKKFRG